MFRLSAEACPNGRLEERTPLIAGAGSPQASAPPSLLSRPLLGDEDAGEELAGRTAGQAVAELEGARHLVAADPLGQESLQCFKTEGSQPAFSVTKALATWPRKCRRSPGLARI